MKSLFLILLLWLAWQNTQAQPPITFERIYSDSGVVEGRRIRQTFDGGYIIAGRKTPPSVFFGNDGTLMKTDSLGNVEWVKVYGTSIDDDWFEDVQQTRDSGFIACGRLPELGMGSNLHVLKTNQNGDTLWSKVWGTNNFDEARFIIETYDGGFATVGDWNEVSGFISRLDNQGDTIWTNYPSFPNGISMYSIAQTQDSGFVATGASYDTVQNIEAYVIRLDKNGNTLWEKNYGYSTPDFGYSIKALSDGNFLVGGYSWDNTNHYDAYLLKLDSVGNIIWSKLYIVPNENGIVELDVTKNGNIIFGGTQYYLSESQCTITCTDSVGNMLWRREYGGTSYEQLFGITICQDSGYALCAGSQSHGIITVQYVVKTDKNGLLTALVQIEDDKTATIKVGPNPFEDYINIYLSEFPIQEYTAILSDALGRTVFSQTVLGGGDVVLNLPQQLPTATYYLQIQDKHKLLVTIPLVRH